MELAFNEIRELLAILNQTDIAELSIKSSDFELTVRKDPKQGDRPIPVETVVAAPTPAPLPAAAPPPPPPVAPPAAPLASDRLVEIVSPMVGTFYRSPAPDEPPFVNVGDRVRTGQTVCIIEAMKLMNDIEAELAGEIVEILLENGQSVEFGQPLMRVNPG